MAHTITGGLGLLQLPRVMSSRCSIWAMLTPKMAFRDRFRDALDVARPPSPSNSVGLTWLVKEFKKRGVEITQPGVGKWYHGEAMPEVDNMVTLAEILGVNVNWLWSGAGPRHPYQLYANDPETAAVITMFEALDPGRRRLFRKLADTMVDDGKDAGSAAN